MQATPPIAPTARSTCRPQDPATNVHADVALIIRLGLIKTKSRYGELFQERTVRSVTANTRDDGRELLEFAATHRLRVTTTPYPMSHADDALSDLAEGKVAGAAVLLPESG